MSEEHTSGDLKFFFGLFLGGIVGALVIFFLGTKEGKKAGKFIEEKGKGALDDLKDKVEVLEEKGQELAAQGEKLKQQVVETMESKGKKIVEQGEELKKHVVETIEEKKVELTDAATEKLDTALAEIETLQAQSMETTAAIRKRFFKNLPKKR